jgi:hypothetical protein
MISLKEYLLKESKSSDYTFIKFNTNNTGIDNNDVDSIRNLCTNKDVYFERIDNGFKIKYVYGSSSDKYAAVVELLNDLYNAQTSEDNDEDKKNALEKFAASINKLASLLEDSSEENKEEEPKEEEPKEEDKKEEE